MSSDKNAQGVVDWVDPRRPEDVIRAMRDGYGDDIEQYLSADGRVHVTRGRHVEFAVCAECGSLDPCECFDEETSG